MDKIQKDNLKTTELTAILGREKFDELADVVGKSEWQAYRQQYELASNLDVVTDYPLQLDFELNASCNLRCPMCPISAESPKGKGPATWFPFELFQEIISDGVSKGLKAVKLNYINEPLIRKDLPKFIEFAKQAGVLDIYLSSNGVLMDEEFARQLIESGLTRIQLSIDAHSSAIYDQVRPGGDLVKVQENVELLMRVRSALASPTPLVRVNFVRTELNEHELPGFIEYWRPRVDMIGIQEYVKPPQAAEALVSKTTENKRERGFRCSFPFKQLVITNERNILPCCTFWGEHLALSHCTGPDSIVEAWNSPKMKALRALHEKGEYWKEAICSQCVDGGLVA